MNPARLAILGVAVVAGGIAAYLASSPSEAPPPAPVAVVPQIKTVDILVASTEIPLGGQVSPRELRWQQWPAEAASQLMISKADQPNAIQELSGAIARVPMLAGEPVRREKLIKTDGAGVMSALLPAGTRALAITIDNRGANTAGNFILPNDRVDIIRVFRDDQASKTAGADVVTSETLLRNVRVLAIGQNIQERNGEKVVVGETATLELDPRQVELIAVAQRAGQLSLSLRSLHDMAKSDDPTVKVEDISLTIVRYGVSQR